MGRQEQDSQHYALEFARKKKPSGRKDEARKGKLPNQVRHDQNAAISVGTWKKRKDRTREKLNNADFNVKRAILVKFIDKIVSDQEYMSVSGYIPFPLRKEVQNVGFKFECGDSGIA